MERRWIWYTSSANVIGGIGYPHWAGAAVLARSQAPAWELSRRSSSFKNNSPRPHHFDQTFLAGIVPRWNRANARAFSGVVCDPGCRRSGIPSRRLCRQRIADLQPYLCLHSGCVPSSQFTPLCCGEKRSRPDPHSRA
jgi:hypothetical protein